MHRSEPDTAGPTPERIRHAGGVEFYSVAGRGRSTRRYTLTDDALGKAWVRRLISGSEYAALRSYALHWLAGGLQGPLGSVDLNRVLAFDPSGMSGLAKTERQLVHRQAYWTAREQLGTRPAFVADRVACFDCSISEVGIMLGYRSPWRGRQKAAELLGEAGYRLIRILEDLR